MSRTKKSISRLIELKAQEVDELRKDMERLDQLLDESKARHDLASQEKGRFLEAISGMSTSGQMLSASSMLEHRGFLRLLSSQTEEAERVVDDINKQRDLAHEGLKQAFVEKKTFELIEKRRNIIYQTRVNRRELTEADDAELVRIRRGEAS